MARQRILRLVWVVLAVVVVALFAWVALVHMSPGAQAVREVRAAIRQQRYDDALQLHAAAVARLPTLRAADLASLERSLQDAGRDLCVSPAPSGTPSADSRDAAAIAQKMVDVAAWPAEWPESQLSREVDEALEQGHHASAYDVCVAAMADNKAALAQRKEAAWRRTGKPPGDTRLPFMPAHLRALAEGIQRSGCELARAATTAEEAVTALLMIRIDRVPSNDADYVDAGISALRVIVSSGDEHDILQGALLTINNWTTTRQHVEERIADEVTCRQHIARSHAGWLAQSLARGPRYGEVRALALARLARESTPQPSLSDLALIALLAEGNWPDCVGEMVRPAKEALVRQSGADRLRAMDGADGARIRFAMEALRAAGRKQHDGEPDDLAWEGWSYDAFPGVAPLGGWVIREVYGGVLAAAARGGNRAADREAIAQLKSMGVLSHPHRHSVALPGKLLDAPEADGASTWPCELRDAEEPSIWEEDAWVYNGRAWGDGGWRAPGAFLVVRMYTTPMSTHRYQSDAGHSVWADYERTSLRGAIVRSRDLAVLWAHTYTYTPSVEDRIETSQVYTIPSGNISHDGGGPEAVHRQFQEALASILGQ